MRRTGFAIQHKGAFIIGDHCHLPRIIIIMQIRSAEHVMAQHAAKCILQIVLGEDLFSWSGRKNGSPNQHDTVAEIRHRTQIMRCYQHQPALAAQFPHQIDNGVLGGDIDTGKRFIKQNNSGFLCQCPGEKYPFFWPPDSSPIWRWK